MDTIDAYLLEPVDGVPNNPDLPLLVYPAALHGEAEPGDALARAFETRFESNQWPAAWRGSVFGYHHFHSNAHEALGVYGGTGCVQFGGPGGPQLEVSAGDAVLIPAGVGHCLLSEDGLRIVGAYPADQDPDRWRAGEGEAATLARNVATTSRPARDPVAGTHGGLVRQWRKILAG